MEHAVYLVLGVAWLVILYEIIKIYANMALLWSLSLLSLAVFISSAVSFGVHPSAAIFMVIGITVTFFELRKPLRFMQHDQSDYYNVRHESWGKLAKAWGLTLEYDEDSHESKLHGDLGGLSVQILDERILQHKNSPLKIELEALGSWPDSILIRRRSTGKGGDNGGEFIPGLEFSETFYVEGQQEDLLLLLTPRVRSMFEREPNRPFVLRRKVFFTFVGEQFDPFEVEQYEEALELGVALEKAWQNPVETLLESIHREEIGALRTLQRKLLLQRFPNEERTQALAKPLLKSSDFSEQILAASVLSDLEHLLGIVEGYRHREDFDKKEEDWGFSSLDEAPKPRGPRHPLYAHQIEALSACRFGDEKGLIAGHLEGLLSKKIFLGVELQLAFVEALRANPHPKNEAALLALLKEAKGQVSKELMALLGSIGSRALSVPVLEDIRDHGAYGASSQDRQYAQMAIRAIYGEEGLELGQIALAEVEERGSLSLLD